MGSALNRIGAVVLVALVLGTACSSAVTSSELWSRASDAGAPSCDGADAVYFGPEDAGTFEYCRWDCVDLVDGGPTDLTLIFDRTKFGWQQPEEFDEACKGPAK